MYFLYYNYFDKEHYKNLMKILRNDMKILKEINGRAEETTSAVPAPYRG